MERRNLPRLAYNWLSIAGSIVAIVSFIMILFLLALSFFSKLESPYIGILLYMILPLFLVIGLVLIPIGMFFEWRRGKKTGEIKRDRWPYIDLNKASHRNATIIFIFGTLIFIATSSVGIYEAYHYSESVEFCGTTCHKVMKPEYTAYKQSPHARVPCTDCHVGPGAGWYTKSKLSGAYQVYAVTANIYPRPIPTPIKNLRPAQETCEQCHWPERFFGSQQKMFDHYMYDESNTHWPINMLLKTGGSNPGTGFATGIHWHININSMIDYIPRDESRQDIPWVKVTMKGSGAITIYQDADNPLTDEEIAQAEPRLMDCMDCHNRPSHQFFSPDFAIDQAINIGLIDPAIPEIKRVAVENISAKYDSDEDAFSKIAEAIPDFYEENYPEFYHDNRDLIDAAVPAIQDAYAKNIFPIMKARWSVYPINVGHFRNIGCMRCHDGNHKSDDGRVISHQCDACHTIMAQGSGEKAEFTSTAEGLEFQHPIDIDEMWREVGCYECHTGEQP
jgi:hypothetical protein